jgi:hypothetical protein
MPFFNRVSETFWSYVSPQKTNTHSNTPKTAPPGSKKTALPIRRASLKNLKRTRKSMSPYERVDSWRATTSTSPSNNDRPNRRAVTPDRNGDGSRKMRKLDDGRAFRAEEVVYEHQDDEEDEDDEEDDDDDERSASDEIMKDDDGLSSMFSAVHVNGSPTPEDFLNEYGSEVDVDETEVLDDGDYHLTPNRRKLAKLPQDESAFGVGSQEMRAAGWDDDYITLVQRIKLRGHEPLMPQRWQFGFRNMPDALFAKTNDAFISSVQREYFRAEKALEKLLDLGGLVRDSLSPDTPTLPHRQIRQNIEAYQKWAVLDSDLDPETVIPVLTLVVRPGDVPADELHDIANQKLGKIAARYRKAFRVLQSTEGSPVSKASSQYSYPIPTLYAMVASHALIAVMAYRPEDETPDAKPIAFFDMKQSNYDVWNSLALAITVCHARNVQMRIAEDTGLGVRLRGGKRSRASEDPDA